MLILGLLSLMFLHTLSERPEPVPPVVALNSRTSLTMSHCSASLLKISKAGSVSSNPSVKTPVDARFAVRYCPVSTSSPTGSLSSDSIYSFSISKKRERGVHMPAELSRKSTSCFTSSSMRLTSSSPSR